VVDWTRRARHLAADWLPLALQSACRGHSDVRHRCMLPTAPATARNWPSFKRGSADRGGSRCVGSVRCRFEGAGKVCRCAASPFDDFKPVATVNSKAMYDSNSLQAQVGPNLSREVKYLRLQSDRSTPACRRSIILTIMAAAGGAQDALAAATAGCEEFKALVSAKTVDEKSAKAKLVQLKVSERPCLRLFCTAGGPYPTPTSRPSPKCLSCRL